MAELRTRRSGTVVVRLASSTLTPLPLAVSRAIRRFCSFLFMFLPLLTVPAVLAVPAGLAVLAVTAVPACLALAADVVSVVLTVAAVLAVPVVLTVLAAVVLPVLLVLAVLAAVVLPVPAVLAVLAAVLPAVVLPVLLVLAVLAAVVLPVPTVLAALPPVLPAVVLPVLLVLAVLAAVLPAVVLPVLLVLAVLPAVLPAVVLPVTAVPAASVSLRLRAVCVPLVFFAAPDDRPVCIFLRLPRSFPYETEYLLSNSAFRSASSVLTISDSCIFPQRPSIITLSCPTALLFFKYSQFCARGPAVFLQFLFAGKDRFTGDHFSFGNAPAHADRKFRGADAGIFIPAECVFDNAVFKRMECNNTEPSAGSQQIDHAVQRIFQYFQFSVAGDSDRLESPFTGIAALLAHFHGNGLLDDLHELAGRFQRRLLTGAHNI